MGPKMPEDNKIKVILDAFAPRFYAQTQIIQNPQIQEEEVKQMPSEKKKLQQCICF
jgi:hypothetical protein